MTHILLYTLLLYGLVVLLANLFQHRFIFQPKKLESDYRFSLPHAFKEIWLEGADSLKIHSLYFPAEAESRGLVLYFHGNADNLQRWGQYTEDFTRLGFEVLAIDYPGYGKSPGTPSENSIFASAELAYQWARTHHPDRPLVIYGRSLGSGPASYLRSQHPQHWLMLETPFYSIQDVMTHGYRAFLPFVSSPLFPVHQYLSQQPEKACIFQGTDDWVVPFASAVKLKPLLADPEQFFIYEGGGHKNLRTFPSYHQDLARMLDQVVE
ncbi:MAG: alpha/beta fold hydrolase [Bacteroidota bacterium]